MHGNAWASLLKHVPAEMHEQMMLVTVGGTEIALSTVLRIDHEFVAFKGRLSGTQDQGRLFFMPFQNIDYLGFQREIKDEKYHEVFGNLVVPPPLQSAPVALTAEVAALPLPAPQAAAPPHPQPPPEPEPVPQPEPAPVVPSASLPARTPMPIKSAVLERFRSRSNQGTAIRPNGEG